MEISNLDIILLSILFGIVVITLFLYVKQNNLLREFVLGLYHCNAYKTDFLVNLIKLYKQKCPEDEGDYDKLVESLGGCKVKSQECVCFANEQNR